MTWNTSLPAAVLVVGAMMIAGCAAPGDGALEGAPESPRLAPSVRIVPAAPVRIPLIGELAPAFTAQTTEGPVKFPDDYRGKWVILFSHPGDFTPVCTSEFIAFAVAEPQLKALNCQLIGLSVDSRPSHIAWLLTIREKIEFQGMKNVEVKFPVIADVGMEVAAKYGMISPAETSTRTVRAVFFIDPQATVRAVIYYPATNGRNIEEIKRILIAMQTSDRFEVSTPANWQPGDDVIVPSPASRQEALQRMENPGAGLKMQDWFMTFKELPAEQIWLPPDEPTK